MKRFTGFKLRDRDTLRSASATALRVRSDMQSIEQRVVKGVFVATVVLLFVMGITDVETYSWLKSLASIAYSSAIRAWHL